MKKCYHNKVFSNHVLTSIPPQRRWICSKCGTRGLETEYATAYGAMFPTYEDVEKHFQKP
jgi:hypothetical protein